LDEVPKNRRTGRQHHGERVARETCWSTGREGTPVACGGLACPHHTAGAFLKDSGEGKFCRPKGPEVSKKAARAEKVGFPAAKCPTGRGASPGWGASDIAKVPPTFHSKATVSASSWAIRASRSPASACTRMVFNGESLCRFCSGNFHTSPKTLKSRQRGQKLMAFCRWHDSTILSSNNMG